MAEQENQNFGFSPLQVVKYSVIILFEIVELITSPFNLTGIWMIIGVGLDIMKYCFLFGLKLFTEGFSLSSILPNKKQVVLMIIGFIPGLSDFLPDFLVYELLGKKKKKPIPTEAT